MGKLWFFVIARIYRKVQSFAANGGKQAEKPRGFSVKRTENARREMDKKIRFFRISAENRRSSGRGERNFYLKKHDFRLKSERFGDTL